MSESFQSVRWNACVHRLDLGLTTNVTFLSHYITQPRSDPQISLSRGERPTTRPQRRQKSGDGDKMLWRTTGQHDAGLNDIPVTGLFVVCLTSQQQASVSQGRVCSDNFTCCHTEVEADQTFSLTQSQYTDTGPTSPSTDPVTPGAWQGSHWSANF